MKHALVPGFLAALALSACTTPIVVDENGWPIGFAKRSPYAAPQAAYGEDPSAADPLASAVPQISASGPTAAPTKPLQAPRAEGKGAPLLGWNGNAVQGPANPTQGAPSHGIEPADGGRMRIIELYQQVLDERDALRDELETMASALDSAQRQLVGLEQQSAALQRRVLELETANESMQAENLDLAARLSTAQIRRLESEKLLLETRIESLRSMALEEPAPTSRVGAASAGGDS